MCLSSGKNVDFKISGATSPEQRSEFMCVYTCECHAQENFAITIEIYGMNIEEEKKVEPICESNGKLKNQEEFKLKK